MSVKLDEKIVQLLNDDETIKIVSSVGRLGIVNSAVKQSIRLNAEGNIEYLEYLESSDTNRNLIHSLWFEHNVSILLIGKNKESYELRGIPIEAVIEGEKFQDNYVEVQEKKAGKLDLATVWVINVTEIRNKNLFERAVQERIDHPVISHLDRLAK